MKLKNKTNPEFEELFSYNSEEDEIEHEAKMLMFHFLDKIQKIADKQNSDLDYSKIEQSDDKIVA